MTTKNIVVTKPAVVNNLQLARIIECANSFKSSLMLSSGDVRTNAKSLLGVLALQLSEGMPLEIIAEGPDEVRAAEELAVHLCS